MVIDPPCASHVSSERKMPIVPSVTMNGSILPSVVVRPLNRPHSAPTASVRTIAETINSGMLSMRPELRNRMVQPASGDDERLADRDRGDERAPGKDVGEVVEAQEARIGQRAEGADQRQRG